MLSKICLSILSPVQRAAKIVDLECCSFYHDQGSWYLPVLSYGLFLNRPFTPSPPWTVSEFLLDLNFIQNGFSSSPSSGAAVSCVSPHIEVLLPPFLPPLLPLDGCSRMYLLFLRTILSKFFGGARSKFFEGLVSAITTHLFSLFAA